MKTTRRGTARLGAVAIAAASLVLTPSNFAGAADPIPDDGLPAIPVVADPLVSERTEPLLYGVTGINENNDSFPNTNIRVTSFAEIGDTMYVGGKFTQVENGTTGARVTQRYLAAFDRNTGDWISSFRPTLNGNVWDLKATDDGKLLVAGQFSNVNGDADTAALAMLDPITGDVDPNWRVGIGLTGSSDRALVRTLDIQDNLIYFGGNFTRVTGPDGNTKNAGRIARVRLDTANADGAFLPNVDGIVFDIDATDDRVYIVGNFFYINDVWSIGMGAVQPANGNLVPGLLPHVRTFTENTLNSYQQAILSLGDEIWMTGAQHLTQVYRKSDYGLLRGFVSDPWGDGQALVEMNGIIYQGSHANYETYQYADTTDAVDLEGWTSRTPARWMSAWDGTIGGSHDNLTWYPQIRADNGEGSWELFADSTDCLWSGGDFDQGSYDGSVPRYVGGFAKFCAADTTPPPTPTAATATAVSNGVNLAWTGSEDDRGGEVRYEVLKNDEVLASYISLQTFRDPDGTADDRYFVRATDFTGNRSATTPVFTAADNDTTNPTTPQNLTATLQTNGSVTLNWDASTDAVGVVDYLVLRNGAQVDVVTVTAATIPAPPPGDSYFQVQARDAAGNTSLRTPSALVTIEAPDTTRPSTPTNLAGTLGAGGNVTLTWTPSTDDTGVASYRVLRNGSETNVVTGPTAVVVSPPVGINYFQVEARDAAGNISFRTPPLVFEVTGPDTVAPTSPLNLAGTQVDDDVTLTWDPSFDATGVVDYIVFRNGVQIDVVTGPTAVVVSPPVGINYFQVEARDAAGNISFRTPSLVFDVIGPDTVAPTTPLNLAGTVGAGGDVTLTWDPSFDASGVPIYIVFRNNQVIDFVTTASLVTTPSPGANYYQVRAVDPFNNQSFKTPSLLITI